MSALHILLQRARTYLPKDPNPEPPDCHYDYAIGAWVNNLSNKPWIDTPDRTGPRTKKEDIETGEDQKRE